MPLLTPIKQRSLSFGTMVADFFVSPLMRNKIEEQENYELNTSKATNPEHSSVITSDSSTVGSKPSRKAIWSNFRSYSYVLFKGALLETLPFDGFDPSTNSYTTANGKFVESYNSYNLPASIFWTSLLGMPNRPSDATEEGEPVLDIKQGFKGWWGSWTALYETEETSTPQAAQALSPDAEQEVNAFSSEGGAHVGSKDSAIMQPGGEESAPKPITKRTWYPLNAKTILQAIPGLFFKFLIILPFKLLTWPFKIALNVVKLFTEALPLYLSNLSAAAIGELAYQNSVMWNKKLSEPRKARPRPHDTTSWTKFWYITPRAIAIFFLGLVHYSTRIIFLVLRAITSPQQSARQAFYAGRGLKIASVTTEEGEEYDNNDQVEWTKTSNVLGFILGSFGALVSLTVSAVGWAIFLPLTLGAISSFVPQLPVLISNIATLPFIANSLATINGALSPIVVLISNTVGAAFAPLISAMASAVPGLVMSAQIIAVGTTLGLLLAPLASISNRVADVFSNFWAAWNPPEHSLVSAIDQEVGVNLKACVSGKYTRLAESTEQELNTAAGLAQVNPGSGGYNARPGQPTSQHVDPSKSSTFSFGGGGEDGL